MALIGHKLLAATLAATLLGAGAAHAASDPKGVWLNDTGRGAIEIKACDGGLCGHVVWVKAGVDSLGCGKLIIDRVKAAGDGTWDDGRVYSPDRKKWYDVDLKLMDGNKLKVTGHAMFLSKSMVWTRAPANLERCDAAVPAPAKSTASSAAFKVAAPAQKAAPIAAAEIPVDADVEENQPAGADENFDVSEGFDLDKGIHIGDTVSIQKTASGKCQIKAPFVNLTVKCPQRD